jgi:O-antigen/teichoic acid export membrane protein/O-antigen ligase
MPRRALRSLLALRRDAAVALLLAQVCVAGSALVVNVLAARALAPSGRGELALLLQVAYLGSLLLLLGIDRSLVAVFGGSPPGTAAKALLGLLLRPSGLGLALALLLLVVPAPWPPSWSRWLAVAALFAVVNAFVRGGRAAAIAADRQADYVRFTLQSQALLLAGAAALAVAGVQDTGAWLSVYLGSAALPTAVQLLRWRPRRADAGREAVSATRREGLQLLPAAIATSGMLRLDRLLLPALASTAALGLYAGVATTTELLSWPLGALADARLGRWRADADAGRLGARRILLGCALYAGVGALAVAWLVATLFLPLLGPSYAPARPLVAPLVAAAGVLGLEQVAVTLLVARRRNRAASAVETVGFAVSVLGYLTLIPAHGALGAAYGSLLGYAAGLLVACALLARGASAAASPSSRAAVPQIVSRGVRAGVGWAPLLPLLLVAIGGTFSLERLGVAAPGWLDLRLIGLTIALPFAAAAARSAVAEPRPVPEGWLIAALSFFALQIGSGLWAPAASRVPETAVDVAATAALTAAVYALARRDPEGVARRTLWFLLVAGLVFAAAAFAGGGGAQGRFAAFGGGPNVFVRIEVLAAVAAVTLLLLGASRWLLLALPPLVVGAVASGSRGGLLAALVVLAVLALRAGPRARSLALAGIAGSGSLLVMTAWLYPPVGDLLRSRFVEQTVEQQYSSGRTSIWQDSLELLAQHPLWGVGLDGFYGSVGQARGIEYPHNYLLAVASEAGLLGLALLTLTVFAWIATVRSGEPGGPATPRDVLRRAMTAGVLFVAVASMFSGGYYDARLAWCFAAVAAALTVPRAGRDRPAPAAGPRPAERVPALRGPA